MISTVTRASCRYQTVDSNPPMTYRISAAPKIARPCPTPWWRLLLAELDGLPERLRFRRAQHQDLTQRGLVGRRPFGLGCFDGDHCNSSTPRYYCRNCARAYRMAILKGKMVPIGSNSMQPDWLRVDEPRNGWKESVYACLSGASKGQGFRTSRRSSNHAAVGTHDRKVRRMPQESNGRGRVRESIRD